MRRIDLEGNRVRLICLVNNHNYGRFLEECLTAVFSQTVAFDAVVVVDDGSTDSSRSVLELFKAQRDNLELILKPNGGQLSCFNAAVPYVRDDDIVVLCDSDDVFPPDYVALMMPRYSGRLADYYFCEKREFSSENDSVVTATQTSGAEDFNFVCTSALVRRFKPWLSRPTSCVSMTGRLYRQLLPFPAEPEWRTRADDVITYGASVIGASKLYVPSVQIGYRVHGNNHWYGKVRTPEERVRSNNRRESVIGWYCDKRSIPIIPSDYDVESEYKLLPEQIRRLFALPDSSVFLKGRKRLVYKLNRELLRIRNQLWTSARTD